jgi:HAD superfamily hydrolase (TIGR01509 family)
MKAAVTPLVIFDCDGVLVNSEPIASQAFADHLQTHGLPYTAEDCRLKFTGLSLESCQQLLIEQHALQLPTGFFDQLQADTFERFSKTLQVIPGITQVLDWLDSTDIPYCVASSGSPDKMRFTLGHTGLLSRFENRLFSAISVKRGKPAPDLFLHAAHSLQFAPEHCLVVEDSVPGIAAGIAAGMRVYAFQPTEPIAGTVTFRDMSELPPAIASSLR